MWKNAGSSVWMQTCKNGQNGFVYSLNLSGLEHVAGEESYYQQHNEDEERP